MNLLSRFACSFLRRYGALGNAGLVCEEIASLQALSKSFDSRWVVHYNQRPNILDTAFQAEGTDKGNHAPTGQSSSGTPGHNYADFYYWLLAARRFEVRKIFECGIGSINPQFPYNMGPFGSPGASLRAWREFFPGAMIYGADIDEATLFQEDRIATSQLDQTSTNSIASFFEGHDPHSFDLIIDDGLHEYEANINLFEGAYPFLKQAGVYVIEDVDHRRLGQYKDYFSGKTLEAHFVSLIGGNRPALINNSLIVITKP